MAAISGLSPAAVATYTASIFIIHLLRFGRWHLMVHSLDPKVSAGTTLRISFLGFAAVFLVPLRLGEFARPLLLKRDCGISLSAGLGTVAVERTVDGLTMLLTLILATAFAGIDNEALRGAAALMTVVFGGAALAFAATARWPRRAEVFWRAALRPLGAVWSDRCIALLYGFLDGLKSLPTWRLRIVYFAMTLAYWGLNAWGMAFLAGAMGIDLSFADACLMMALLVVGIMIPAGPGSLGTFHAPIIFASTVLFAAPLAKAQAFALALHLIQLLHMVLVALPFIGDLGAALRPQLSETSDASAPAS
jgi:uncharacterized protein (TIRG00374 family)